MRKNKLSAVAPATGMIRGAVIKMKKKISLQVPIDNYYTLWPLPQVQISVIPACPESFRKDSRRALLAGMTPKKHSNHGRPAVSAAGFFTVVLLSFFIGVFSGCSSKPAETAVRPEKVDAELAQKLLTDGNSRFAEGRTLKKDFLTADLDPLNKNRRPFAVFLACSDSEVSPEILFDRNIGDLLVVRTVGNVLDTIVLGSVEYGVEHYKAPLVVVLGHRNCGIIEELIRPGEQCPGNIPRIQEKIKKAVNKAIEGGEKGDALLSRAATNNVLEVIEELKTSHIIQEFKTKYGLKVIGATYDDKTGKVVWIENGGCDLGEGFIIPDKKAKTARADFKKWDKPSEK